MESQDTASAAAQADTKALPRAVVFDLDGCVWDPEMYQLWGGGAPFTVQPSGNLKDRAGVEVHLLGAVRDIMYELKTDPK